MILEDDESDTPNPEVAAEPSKPTDPPRWDVEDGCFIGDDFRPIPLLEQEGLASTPTLVQEQPHSRHHSPRPSQDQINQLDNGTTQNKSEEPEHHSLPTTLDESGGGGNTEKLSLNLKQTYS